LIISSSSDDNIGRFDWATQTWSQLSSAPTGVLAEQHHGGHYHPLVGKMIFGSSDYPAVPHPMVILDSSLNVTTTKDNAPVITGCWSKAQFFPHPTRNASIAIDSGNNKIYSYEWDSDTWVDRGAIPTELDSDYVIAAPTSWGALFFKWGASGTSTAYAWKPGF
jgi:hypothetical protein